MDYDIVVSPELLIAGADSMQAMAEDCEENLPAKPTTSAKPTDADTSRADSHRPQDDVGAAGQAATAAYLDAIRSAGRAVRQSSQALRSSAWDYLNTEDQATELINRGIGRALGELS